MVLVKKTYKTQSNMELSGISLPDGNTRRKVSVRLPKRQGECTKLESSIKPYIAADTETTGLDVYGRANPFAVGICDPLSKEGTLYWEWTVDPETRLPQYVQSDIDEIDAILNQPGREVVFHNAKFDLDILLKLGIEVRNTVHDTSFASRICNNLEETYALKPLAFKYFNIPIEDEVSLQKAVLKVRSVAKRAALAASKGKSKEGLPDTSKWLFHEQTKADYWAIQLAPALGIKLERFDYCEEYCKTDTVRTAVLWEMYAQIMADDPVLLATYLQELELLPMVREMERRGFHISRSATRKELVEAEAMRTQFLESLQATSKNPHFNPGSNVQLSKVLYSKTPSPGYPVVFGLIPQRATKTGFSTDEDSLRVHGENHFVRELLQYREVDKAISTFYTKYLALMTPDTVVRGYPDSYAIHCSLNQCGTKTLRFSANEPNLQQASNPEVSDNPNVHARRPFGPRPGYYLYSIDFSGQEGRIFAYYAQVKAMLEAIYAGEDFNTNNANLAWGNDNPASLEVMSIALELGSTEPSRAEVAAAWKTLGWNKERASRYGFTGQYSLSAAKDFLSSFGYDIVAAEAELGKSLSRQRGKIILFVKIYGGGAGAAASQLYCSVDRARAFMRDLERPFPEMRRFINELSRQAYADGYITTCYGNKLRIERDFSYKAVNWLIQGTAAQMMKTGIRKSYRYLKGTGLDAHLILTVHDEIILEVNKEHAYKRVLRDVCDIMSDTGEYLSVPMPVQIKRCSRSWEEKEKVKL